MNTAVRNALVRLVSLFVLLLAARAHAAPFTPEALAAAQATGRPVLVEVWADWCTVCAKQKPIVSGLLKHDDFKGYQVLTVDFDKQPDALKQLKVQMQSTLIVFKGKQEAGRSTGETNRDQIAALLKKGL